MSSPSQSGSLSDVGGRAASTTDDAVNENCKTGKVYPGDLVVYRSKHPWDWSPTYGTVILQQSARDPPTPNAAGNTASLRTASESGVITVEEQPGTASSLKLNDSKVGKQQESVEPHSAPVHTEDTNSNFTVHWDTSNRMRQMKRSEVCVIDRMLVRGTRVRGTDGMGGTVINYNVKATLQLVGTNHVIQNVPISDLNPISPFVRGQQVLYKHWVGVITNVKRKVWFRFDGGLTFHIETMESDGFMKTDPYWGLGVACPGVRTPFSPGVLRNAKWASKYMKFLWKWVPPLSFLYSFSSATATKVEASAVSVKWLAPAPNSTASADVPPPITLERGQMEDLQILSMPNSEYAGLNSVRVYRVKPEDNITTYGVWFSQFRHKFMEQGGNRVFSNFSNPGPPMKQLAGVTATEVPVKILLRHNYVDILWDNGKRDRMSTIDVPVVYEPKCHDTLRCGMVVVSEHCGPDSKRYGVVQDSEDLVEGCTNTVRVHWFGEGNQRERVVLDEGVSEESVYSLLPHSKYSLFQRETILFSVDPDLHEFSGGIVIDVDVRQGNMIIYCTDGRYRKVWPHMVIPFSKRCTWNFFTRKWVVDEIIPPPHQLNTDHYPKSTKLSSREVEESLLKLKAKTKSKELWEDPPFDLLEHCPEFHWYSKPIADGIDPDLMRIVRNEFDLIRSAMPEGVWVRVYEDRMDLVSVMILGPPGTPYEDGLFFFDMRLPKGFPRSPPQIHFISYGGEIHPFLAEDGNFCEANLHWKYEADEVEGKQSKSFILEAIRSVEKLFLTKEPYYADGVRTLQGATSKDRERSRSYNEMIFLQVLDNYYQTAVKPHEPWKRHIAEHVFNSLPKKVALMEKWILSSDPASETGSTASSSSTTVLFQPAYPLLPASKGFRMTLESRMKNLRMILATCLDPPTPEVVEEDDVKPVPVKPSSRSNLLSTIEEILHEQKWELLKTAKEKMDDPEEDPDNETAFSLADL